MKIAFSPCPNDTFLFGGWACGKLPLPPPQVTYGDIEQLNKWACQGLFSLCKVSFATLGHVLKEYILLPTGSAIGQGCGPKLIARTPFPLHKLNQKKVAIPGEMTSAHMYLQLLTPTPRNKHFCLYDEIEMLLESGAVDAGVIIHEQRFTFAQRGFVEIADLGTLWEEKTKLPIPLGGLIAKRDLPNLDGIVSTLQQSLSWARENPKSPELESYILTHSLEKERNIVDQHIDLYVTQDTHELSQRSIEAIETLLQLGQESGLIPKVEKPWLFSS